MKILGLITARSGSKRIPGKNMKVCAGKPLIRYTIDAVKNSVLSDCTYVSTDDENIAEYCQNNGIGVPFMRPYEISQDASQSIEVLKHFSDWAEGRVEFDAIMILQPTSPLRTGKHVNEAVKLYSNNDVDTLVSVYDLYEAIDVSKFYFFSKDKLSTLKDIINNKNINDDESQVFVRNGPSILITKKECVKNGVLYGDNILPYIMSFTDSVDIDVMEDFKIAEYRLENHVEN